MTRDELLKEIGDDAYAEMKKQAKEIVSACLSEEAILKKDIAKLTKNREKVLQAFEDKDSVKITDLHSSLRSRGASGMRY